MFQEYDEREEHRETRLASEGTPVWQLIVSLLLGCIALMVIGGVVAMTRGITPTMYNMLNDTAVTAPFVVTAINALQAAHFLVSLALYYRARKKAQWIARVQLGLAAATHGTLLMVLFLLPFLGWSQDWASPVAMVVWGAWEVAVLVGKKQFV